MEQKEEKKEQPAAEQKPAPAAPAPASAVKPDFGKGKTVLVIDDDPGAVELVKGILEKVGCEVMSAGDGKEGLSKISITKPSLIIADVLMPHMDGFAFFKELKKNKETETIPVLILTIRKNMEDSFMAMGADGFTVKPVETEALLAKVSQLLTRAPRTAAKDAPAKPEEKKRS